MTTARELLQEARKILEHASPSPGWVPDFDDAILRIDAFLAQPEPEPSAEVEKVTAQDSGETDVATGIKRLKERSSNPWREAVIDELVTCCIYSEEHDHNPRKAIHDAISWNVQVALDPQVSSDAQALIDRGSKKAQPESAAPQVPYAVWRKGFDAVREWKEAAKPEPSAEVERIMELADQYYRSAYHDESSIERESLRAEVERMVRMWDGARKGVEQAAMVNKLLKERAEAAEREAKRYRWLRNERAVVEVGGRTASLWFDYKRASDINDHTDEAIEKDRLALDAAIDAAIAQEKP